MEYLALLKELTKAVTVTLILPIAVLCFDYFIRVKIDGGPFSKLIQESGPDGCILSIGSTGAIFLDPKISSIQGMTSPILIIFLVLFLLLMRIACIKNRNEMVDEKSSIQFGVCSLLVVFFVIVIGYLLPVIT